MLKEANTALGFSSFENRDGVQKLVASMPDDQAHGEWKLHTLKDMRSNDNPQHPPKYWSQDIITSMRWLMRQAALAGHYIDTRQHCFNSHMPPKRLYTEMYMADWWRETHARGDNRGWRCANWYWVNAQGGGCTSSLDLHVWQNTFLEFCSRQEKVACIYDDWHIAIYHRGSARCSQCTAWCWWLSCRFRSGTAIFLWSCWMSTGKQTERSWMRYTGSYSMITPSNKIPAPRVGITTFSVQMPLQALQSCISSMACRLPWVLRPTWSRVACVLLVQVSQERTWRIRPSRPATPQVGSQRILNAQRYQHLGSRCHSLVVRYSPRIQCVSTYSLYREWPPKARPPPYNADPHAWHPLEVEFSSYDDAWTARQVQCNMVIRACSPQPPTKS